jgi:hypothetical protein
MTPTTATGFNDPTAQRLEAIATGAEPEVVGPLLADALHDPRWKGCDVALISGGMGIGSDVGGIYLKSVQFSISRLGSASGLASNRRRR